ncbi:hypothetical protein TRFO_08051 [Tritrichomonas foetus]|uniref:Uncharacterized protein n=1 Tax=Tritrichomonas foetus TaxID=1144522 RepID=A0A1J4JLX4_9EUKA|nr:hypothetical protein TRFO_08051 [Tritrichomonas foetus]|eukprot:OHT00095.1 hypothetical protein TRFO_08051 [Tritrichomonas foetus]
MNPDSIFTKLYEDSTSPKPPRKAESIEQARINDLSNWHSRLSSDNFLSMPLPLPPNPNPREPSDTDSRSSSSRRMQLCSPRMKRLSHSARSFIPQISLPVEGDSPSFITKVSPMAARTIVIPQSNRNSSKGKFRKTTTFPVPKRIEPQDFSKTLP